MKRLICWLVGHQYRLPQSVCREPRHICCDRCSGSWVLNEFVKAGITWVDGSESLFLASGRVIEVPRKSGKEPA